jgi:hypothetical protein
MIVQASTPSPFDHFFVAGRQAALKAEAAREARRAREAAFVGYSTKEDGMTDTTLHGTTGEGGLHVVSQKQLKVQETTAVAAAAAAAAAEKAAAAAAAEKAEAPPAAAPAEAAAAAAEAAAAAPAEAAAAAAEAAPSPAAEPEPDANQAPDEEVDAEEEQAGEKNEAEDAGEEEGSNHDGEQPGGNENDNVNEGDDEDEDDEDEEGDEEEEEDEEDEEDDTPEGKELREKSNQAKRKGILRVKKEASGHVDSEHDSEEDQQDEEKKEEGEEESAPEGSNKKQDTPEESSSASDDESSEAEGNQLTLRHPKKQNVLAGKAAKAEHVKMWGESEGDRGSDSQQGTEVRLELTAAEEEKMTYLQQIFCTQGLLIVSDQQAPKAVHAAEPAWLLMLRKVAVADCSDSFAEQLIQELCSHQLVHCSLTGFKEQVTDQTVQNLVALLSDGCMSLVSATYRSILVTLCLTECRRDRVHTRTVPDDCRRLQRLRLAAGDCPFHWYMTLAYVQFYADAELDNVPVTHPEHTTFKKAMNANMQENRKGTKDSLEKMFASANYPQELWPLISKQQVWYDYITAHRHLCLKKQRGGKDLVSLQLQPNEFDYACAGSREESAAKPSTAQGRVGRGKQASVPQEH